MTATNSFRDLRVWQEAMALVDELYDISRGFPTDERYGLTSQLRRAAVSIPSNIGEGAWQNRRRAYLHHLDISLGSQGEVDVQMEIALRQRYLSRQRYDAVQQRIDRIGRMLNRLIESLQPTEEDWSS